MRRSALLLPALLVSMLASCAPAALRGQPGSDVSIQTSFNASPVQDSAYRRPGPSVLSVQAPAGSFVYPLLLSQGSGAVLLGGQNGQFQLPALSGFEQLFTVVSRTPLNLDPAAVASARSLSALGEVVAAATRTLPAGDWNVRTDIFRISDFGTLYVNTLPRGSVVSVDGRTVGTTPLRLDNVEVGRVDVSVQQPGYLNQSVSVRVWPGQTSTVQLGLVPLSVTSGLISVSSSVPATVSIDGQPPLAAPISVYQAAGTHTVVVTAAAGSQSLSLLLRPGATLSVSCTQTGPDFRCSL